MDVWGVNLVVAGSQKGLMLPPGLAFCALNEPAWRRVETSRLPKYYFDLAAERETVLRNEAHFTPSVSIDPLRTMCRRRLPRLESLLRRSLGQASAVLQYCQGSGR